MIKSNVRPQFTLTDMIRALQGFRSPEGYAVIPNDIVDRILAEVDRLYQVEDEARIIYEYYRGDISDPDVRMGAIRSIGHLIGEI